MDRLFGALVVVLVSPPCLAQAPYRVPPPVDLSALPSAFVEAEQDYLDAGGQIFNGTEDVNSVWLLFDHLKPYANDDSEYYTGNERAFMQEVQRAAPLGSDVRLGPDDLYRIALDVNGGDRFAALITVHDAFKFVGRAIQVGRATPDEQRPLVDGAFYDDYVASRGGHVWEGGRFSISRHANGLGEAYLAQVLEPIGNGQDYTGRYYHMFGVAAAKLVGGVAGDAYAVHGAQADFADGFRSQVRYARQLPGFWSRLGAYIQAPGVGVFAAFGDGGYTRSDKYDADVIGAAIGERLRDEPEYAGSTADDGLAGGPPRSDYARRLLGEPVATPGSSSLGDPVDSALSADDPDDDAPVVARPERQGGGLQGGLQAAGFR